MYLVFQAMPQTLWALWLELRYTAEALSTLQSNATTTTTTTNTTQDAKAAAVFTRNFLGVLLTHCLNDPRCTLSLLKVIQKSWAPRLVVPPHPDPASEQAEILGSTSFTHTAIIRKDIPLRLFRRICTCDEKEELCTGPCRIRGHPIVQNFRKDDVRERVIIQSRFRTTNEVLNILEFISEPSTYSLEPPTVAPETEPHVRLKTLIEFILEFDFKPRFSAQHLALATSSHSLRLVKYLLQNGKVRPDSGGGMAVKAAIRKNDLRMVKMLIERFEEDPDEHLPEENLLPSGMSSGGSQSTNRKRRTSTGKRRRLEDRMEVTQSLLREALRADARSVVEYFINEKGCTPDARTLARTFF